MELLLHPAQTNRLISIRLPNPREGQPDNVYLVDQINFTVNEIVQYSDKFRSWFADNSLIKDGSLNMITPVDRLFIMLPLLLKSKSQFKTLDDIINSSEHSEDLTLVLSPDTDWNVICDTKDIDEELYIRYNQEKVLNWLENKRVKIIEYLRNEMEPTTSLATLRSYSGDLLADYLPNELCDIFKNATRGETVPEDKINKPAADTTKAISANKNRPNTSGSKRGRSDSKESSNYPDKSSNKLTKWFSPVSR